MHLRFRKVEDFVGKFLLGNVVGVVVWLFCFVFLAWRWLEDKSNLYRGKLWCHKTRKHCLEGRQNILSWVSKTNINYISVGFYSPVCPNWSICLLVWLSHKGQSCFCLCLPICEQQSADTGVQKSMRGPITPSNIPALHSQSQLLCMALLERGWRCNPIPGEAGVRNLQGIPLFLCLLCFNPVGEEPSPLV